MAPNICTNVDSYYTRKDLKMDLNYHTGSIRVNLRIIKFIHINYFYKNNIILFKKNNKVYLIEFS